MQTSSADPARWRQRRRTVSVALACLLIALAASTPGWTDDVSPLSADKLKAAYIFNFAKFVEWPNSGTADDLLMCFMGAPGVFGLLAHDVGGTLIGQRRVVVRSIEMAEPADSCSLLYVDASVATLSKVTSRASSHALTISDRHDFTRLGGTIEMFADGSRLRFNVNLGNARSAGLRISSQLLQLASKVEQE